MKTCILPGWGEYACSDLVRGGIPPCHKCGPNRAASWIYPLHLPLAEQNLRDVD